jgi:hypothetical protein
VFWAKRIGGLEHIDSDNVETHWVRWDSTRLLTGIDKRQSETEGRDIRRICLIIGVALVEVIRDGG